MNIAQFKTCTRCSDSVPLSGFYVRSKAPDGLHPWCKPCVKDYDDERRAKFTPEQMAKHAAGCKRWRLENADRYKKAKSEYWDLNQEDIRAKQRKYYLEYPARRLFSGAKSRAKKRGIPFTISLDDILPLPDKCPILGIDIRVSIGGCDDHSFSIDRIDNSKGYEPGNVTVISRRANRIKNDASFEEIELIYNWLKEKRS